MHYGVAVADQEGARDATEHSPLTSPELAGREDGPNDLRLLSAKRWSLPLPLSAWADS